MSNIIVVDAGHGGDDNGAMWGFEEEDDINLSVSFLLRCELKQLGFTVFLTRESDKFVSLGERTQFVNKMGCDLFISIHCDAFHHETVSGMSVHTYPECSLISRIAASNVLSALSMEFPQRLNRGVRKSDFYVLRKTVKSAILVECEFLSNPETRKFLHEPENQLGLARAISKGVFKTFKV